MKTIETKLQTAAGIGLWSISALFSIRLFTAIAGEGSPLLTGLAIASALFFEAGKIALWRSGGTRRALSLLFIALSIAATGAAIHEQYESYTAARIARETAAEEEATAEALEAVRDSLEYRTLETAAAEITENVGILTDRLKSYRADWHTRTASTTDRLEELRAERAAVLDRLKALEATATPSEPERTGTPRDWQGIFFLAVLVIAGISLEAGAIALLSSRREKEITTAPEQSEDAVEVSPETGLISFLPEPGKSTTPKPPRKIAGIALADWLEAFLEGGRRPYLRGRNRVCEKLNVTDHSGRIALRAFYDLGIIEVKNKRTVLAVSEDQARAIVRGDAPPIIKKGKILKRTA